MPAAPCPEIKARCRLELGQPLTAAAPPTAAAPADGVVLALELTAPVAEALVLVPVLDAVVAVVPEDGAAAGVLLECCALALVVELEPPQAVRARATTAASGKKQNERIVLIARTLAKRPPG